MPDTARRQRDDLLVVLSAIPERVADLTSMLDERQLDYRHAPALPTLGELASHLRATSAAVDAALRQAFLDGRGELRLREALAPDEAAGPSTSLPDLLDDMTRMRRRTVDLLRGLPSADWTRALADPCQGDLDLYSACSLILNHDLGHLAQIRNLVTLLPTA
jgi:DinB superfamily